MHPNAIARSSADFYNIQSTFGVVFVDCTFLVESELNARDDYYVIGLMTYDAQQDFVNVND